MHILQQKMTEDTKNASDINAMSTSIGGGGGMVQHLDETNSNNETAEQIINDLGGLQPIFQNNTDDNIGAVSGGILSGISNNIEPEQQPEQQEETKPMTQGEYQTALNEINHKIESNNNDIMTLQDALKAIANGQTNYISQEFNGIMGDLVSKHQKLLQEQLGITNLNSSNWTSKEFNQAMTNAINEKLEQLKNENSSLYTQKYEYENSKDYDNRTPDQIREDTEYQRTAQDMYLAGLNKAGLSGGLVGSSGGSRSDEEDKKRKKRKKELEEARAQMIMQQQAEQQRKFNDFVKVLGVVAGLVGSVGLIGSSVYNANSRIKSADIYAKSRIDTANIYKSKPKKKNQKWVDDYLNDDLANWG